MSKAKVPSVSESVTRSPIELFWTAKNGEGSVQRMPRKHCLTLLCLACFFQTVNIKLQMFTQPQPSVLVYKEHGVPTPLTHPPRRDSFAIFGPFGRPCLRSSPLDFPFILLGPLKKPWQRFVLWETTSAAKCSHFGGIFPQKRQHRVYLPRKKKTV